MPAPCTFVLSGQALTPRHSLSAFTPVPARLHKLGTHLCVATSDYMPCPLHTEERLTAPLLVLKSLFVVQLPLL